MRALNIVLMTCGCVTLLFLLIMRICLGISFDLKCTQYMKRAADSNTIELAKQNMEVSIKYLERKDLTNGIVSIFLHQPENDVGFWYTNLKASLEELSKVTENTTQLETSNILMKLRETLTDISHESGTVITCPDGISIYPYNALVFWLMVVSFCTCVGGAAGFTRDIC